MLWLSQPLINEDDLLARCRAIEGLSFAQLAEALARVIPLHPLQRKGWAGQAIEFALGATAGNQSKPDFDALGIELKTVPINSLAKPTESTFVTTIPLLTLYKQSWETSDCFAKLKRVLWIPVEGDAQIPFKDRRIGQGRLWSPSFQEEAVLKNDWSMFAFMIGTGLLSQVDARLGDYLQVRPKAAHGQVVCYGLDETGSKKQTLPRGFYLRRSFTATLIGK